MPLSPAELAALRDIEVGLMTTTTTTFAASRRVRLWLTVWLAGGLLLAAAGAVTGTVAGMVLGGTWTVLAVLAKWVAAHMAIMVEASPTADDLG